MTIFIIYTSRNGQLGEQSILHNDSQWLDKSSPKGLKIAPNHNVCGLVHITQITLTELGEFDEYMHIVCVISSNFSLSHFFNFANFLSNYSNYLIIFHLDIPYYLSKYLTFICTLCVISSDPISVYATFSTLQIFSIQLASNIQCSGVFTNFKWNIVIVSKKSKSFRMLTKESWRYRDGASSS